MGLLILEFSELLGFYFSFILWISSTGEGPGWVNWRRAKHSINPWPPEPRGPKIASSPLSHKSHRTNASLSLVPNLGVCVWERERGRGRPSDEGGGGDSGVEQDAKVGGGGGGSAVPQQALQPLRQAHLQIHGARREQRVQHRRSGLQPHFPQFLKPYYYYFFFELAHTILLLPISHFFEGP